MIFVENFIKKIEIEQPYKKIEYAGKICYKSQNNITETSCENFVKTIVKNGHYSVLEHEVFSILIGIDEFLSVEESLTSKDFQNMFFNISFIETVNSFLITANVRAWLEFFKSVKKVGFLKIVYFYLNLRYPIIFSEIFSEHSMDNFIKDSYCVKEIRESEIKLMDFSEQEKRKHLTATFHIRTDRSTSHQLVRHRLTSFSQESQRYCVYASGKLGTDIKFIIPNDLKEQECTILDIFSNACAGAEEYYTQLIKAGLKPELARSVLPNSTATEIIMTSNLTQWDRFINLRADLHAQRDIREIAFEIRKQLYE